MSTSMRIRIVLAAALIVVPIVSLIEFRGRLWFADSLVLSIGALITLIPMMWIDWFWMRGLSFIHLGLVGMIGFDMLALWRGGNRFDASFLTVAFLLGWAALLRKAMRPSDKIQQQANFEFLKSEDIRCAHVLLNTIVLLACFMKLALLWRDPNSPKWVNLLLLPMTWFGWRVIWHLFAKPRSLHRNTGSTIEVASEETHV